MLELKCSQEWALEFTLQVAALLDGWAAGDLVQGREL
jgi:hypothetical protein